MTAASRSPVKGRQAAKRFTLYWVERCLIYRKFPALAGGMIDPLLLLDGNV